MFKFSSDTGDKKRRPGRTASRTVRSGGARRVSVAPKNRGLSWVDRVDWGKARIAAVVAIFCVLWLGLWGRAWYLQMIEGPRLADKARRQHMATELVTGKRGMIMDRNGQVLARSVEARSVYARPQEIQDFLTMANTLGPILGIEPQKLYDELSKTKRRFVWVRRKVDDYTAEAVRKAGLPGIGLSKEYDRVYPFKHLAGQLLGFVGVDDKGLEGLERSLDDRLAGTPTRMVVQRDAMGLPGPAPAGRLGHHRPGRRIPGRPVGFQRRSRGPCRPGLRCPLERGPGGGCAQRRHPGLGAVSLLQSQYLPAVQPHDLP